METQENSDFVTESGTIKQALKPFINMTDEEQQAHAREIAEIIERVQGKWRSTKLN